MKILQLIIILILVGISYSISSSTHVYATCSSVDCGSGSIRQSDTSQIIISKDTFSPNSQVNIVIHAPDFNSNPYAIDTLGLDSSKIVISTREGSIPYRLVETGPDTGDFAGYVTLSSTSSICSPVCGPSDGFLAAGGDDAITVSLIYSGRVVSSATYGSVHTIHEVIPEFPFAEFVLIMSVGSVIYFSKMKLKFTIFRY